MGISCVQAKVVCTHLNDFIKTCTNLTSVHVLLVFLQRNIIFFCLVKELHVYYNCGTFLYYNCTMSCIICYI